MRDELVRFVLKHFLRFLFSMTMSVGFLILLLAHREYIGVGRVYLLQSVCFVSGLWYSAFLLRGCLIQVLILSCCLMVDIALGITPVLTMVGLLLFFAGSSFGFAVRGAFYLMGRIEDAPVFQVFVLVVTLLIVGYFFLCI